MTHRILLACALVAAFPLAARANLPIAQIAVTGTPAPGGGTFVSFGAPVADWQHYDGNTVPGFWYQATTSTGVSGIYGYDYSLNQFFDFADSTMTVPQGGATFSSFSDLSSDNDELAFIATDSAGGQDAYGIYPILTFTLVPPSNSLLPTPPELMGSPTMITNPNGTPLGNILSVAAGGGGGTSFGVIESESGIYTTGLLTNVNHPGYAPSLIVDTTTVPTGASGPFTSFGTPSLKTPKMQGNIPGQLSTIMAFRATAGGVEGIYWGDSESLLFPPIAPIKDSMVNAGDPVPGANGAPSPGTFTSFGDPIATSNEVAFTAHYNVGGQDQQGIFVYGPYEWGDLSAGQDLPSPSLEQFVATGDVAPDSGGATFTGFTDLADNSYQEIFVATLSDGNKGLYVCNNEFGVPSDAILLKAIETGEILDGKMIVDLQLSPDSSEYWSPDNTNYTTFKATFADGSQGIYYFNLPEPGCLAILALPLFLGLRGRRRDRV